MADRQSKVEERQLIRSFFMEARPADVFAAVSTPSGMSQWLCANVKEEPTGFTMTWKTSKGDCPIKCRVTLNHSSSSGEGEFAFDWESAIPGLLITSNFQIAPSKGGTRLTFRESGYGSGSHWRKLVEQHAQHWDSALARLNTVCGGIQP
jgi:uncharacterized protein YndB with AHSA1/START domain